MCSLACQNYRPVDGGRLGRKGIPCDAIVSMEIASTYLRYSFPSHLSSPRSIPLASSALGSKDAAVLVINSGWVSNSSTPYQLSPLI